MPRRIGPRPTRPAAEDARTGPSRRRVMAAGLAGASLMVASGTSGCGIRLEDDAPDLPLLEPKSIPDQALLITAVHRCEALRTATAGLGSAAAGIPAEATLVHARQHAVLTGLLAARGVPSQVVASAAPVSSTAADGATGSPSTGSGATPAPTPDLPAVAAAEQYATSAGELAALATCSTVNRALLAALTSCHSSIGHVLGAPASWPAADPLPAGVAARLLDASRSASYGIEVAAARLPGADREVALQTRRDVRSREVELAALAGPAAAAPPLGYALPFPVATPDDARRLLTVVMGGLVARGLDAVAPADGSPSSLADGVVGQGSSAVVQLVRFHVQAVLLARRFGIPFAPFPGLVDG